MPEFIYEMPKDREMAARVVELFPPDWPLVRGGLFAALELYENNRVAKGVELKVGLSSTDYSHLGVQENTAIWPYGKGGPIDGPDSDPIDVVLENKWPACASLNSRDVEKAKRIAAAFLRRGYFGRLCVSSASSAYNPSEFEISDDNGEVRIRWPEKTKANGNVKKIFEGIEKLDLKLSLPTGARRVVPDLK